MIIEILTDDVVKISGLEDIHLNQEGVKSLAKLLHQVGNFSTHVNKTPEEIAKACYADVYDVYKAEGKIKALKRTRILRGVGLKAAKDYVEAVWDGYSWDYCEELIRQQS